MELVIDGMSCEGCVRSVTKLIQRMDPDAKVAADLATKRVAIDTTASEEALRAALDKGGYTPRSG